jgi:hypothetical protein
VTLHGNEEALVQWAGLHGEQWGLNSAEPIIQRINTMNGSNSDKPVQAVLVAPREKIRRGLGSRLLGGSSELDVDLTAILGSPTAEQTAVPNAQILDPVSEPRLQAGIDGATSDKIAEAAVTSPAAPVPDFKRCRIRVNPNTGQIWLDDEELPKRCNKPACIALVRLIAAKGKALPPDKLMKVDNRYRTEHKNRVRPVIQQLPEPIQALIVADGKPGGGRVLKAEAYHAKLGKCAP